jgi:hypothetical protein
MILAFILRATQGAIVIPGLLLASVFVAYFAHRVYERLSRPREAGSADGATGSRRPLDGR